MQVKRITDLILSTIGLLVLSPLLLILALLVLLFHGRPVFFTQERPGLNGKPFHMLKFRSMSHECDDDGHLLPDADRLTRFGSLLRNTSLDEFPELLNVVTGDMSLVGPRPLMMEYLDRYTPEQARRHEVRPGITGWAQVNGRNALSWEERLRLDVWYVDNRGIWLDLKILCMTVLKVIKREGISAQGEATMSEFMGRDSG